MERNVIDLIMFLDVCQLYLQSRTKSRAPCTLWAVLTYIRTEDSADFLNWCSRYTIPYLRYHDGEDHSAKTTGQKLKGFERKILKLIQELFYCGCPPSEGFDF